MNRPQTYQECQRGEPRAARPETVVTVGVIKHGRHSSVEWKRATQEFCAPRLLIPRPPVTLRTWTARPWKGLARLTILWSKNWQDALHDRTPVRSRSSNRKKNWPYAGLWTRAASWCEPLRNGIPNGAPDDFSRSWHQTGPAAKTIARIQPRAGVLFGLLHEHLVPPRREPGRVVVEPAAVASTRRFRLSVGRSQPETHRSPAGMSCARLGLIINAMYVAAG